MATKLIKANKAITAQNDEEIKYYKKLGYKVPVKAKRIEKSMIKVKVKKAE